MERAAKCKHDVLVTSPPVSFTHFRHCPPAVGLRTPLTTRGRRVIPVWKQWFERHREWRYVTCDKLPVGIEFHTAHCRLSDRRGWPDGAGRRLLSAQYWARLLRKVLGQYQYHPIPQYRYRSNPIGKSTVLEPSVMAAVERYVCVVYGKPKYTDVDNLIRHL